MKIWLINHYAVPPQYYPLARPSLFAKNLIKMGHEVTIIAASTVHNSDLDMINDRSRVKKEIIDGIPYVFIKCRHYKGNGINRVINILEFAVKLPWVCKALDKPDAIVATSFDPLSCYQGIRYAKRYGIKAIAEIADLWPETLVSYGVAKPSNPLVRILRQVEKRIYTQSDAIIFTMEGAYNYISEQHWENLVPKSKVHYINNGVDLEQFDYNKNHFVLDDIDLSDPDLFKVVYTGSIRKVNNLGKIIEVAQLVNNPVVKFLIWGDGDELVTLKNRIKERNIDNIVFKGRVDKRYVPFITSSADLNIVHNGDSNLFRFGISFNKIFDYLAAGKPILCDFNSKYNPVIMNAAGLETKTGSANDIAELVDFISHSTNLSQYSENAKKAAEKYDFKVLSKSLVDVIDSIM